MCLSDFSPLTHVLKGYFTCISAIIPLPRCFSASGATSWTWTTEINALMSKQNGSHFSDGILKCIFLNENAWISIKISLKFVPRCPINNIPTLVWIVAWRRPGDNPLSEPMVISLLTHICVTRPQCVKQRTYLAKCIILHAFINAVLPISFSYICLENCFNKASFKNVQYLPAPSLHGNVERIFSAIHQWTQALFNDRTGVSQDDVIKWKHFPRYWPFVRGIHRSPVNSPHKGQWRRALMCSLICVWINAWVNNREAGDLRRYRAHYDVTVMSQRGRSNTACKKYIECKENMQYDCRIEHIPIMKTIMGSLWWRTVYINKGCPFIEVVSIFKSISITPTVQIK